MTVYLPKNARTWRYDFWFHGKRYADSTKQITREDAEDAEISVKRGLHRRAAGLPALEARPLDHTPRFTEWAAVTLKYAKTRKHLKRPEQFAINLRMVLGFWGATPTKSEPLEDAPYHDLRLEDPIRDPELIEKFEVWMDTRGISGPRKNHYRSAMSQMYRVALQPAYRKRAGVTQNPFANIVRDRVPKHLGTVTLTQFRAIVERAPWHTRVALAIGALAPKLRLNNVLSLRWDTHITADYSTIEHPDHKTDQETGLPLIVPISPPLKAILEEARRYRRGPFVVHYHGRAVKDIKTGLKHAVAAAAAALKDKTLKWGKHQGITYHSLRHTMGTELARMGLPESLRSRLMGHSNLATTQIYTHMVAADELAPLTELAARMPIGDLIGAPSRLLGRLVGPQKAIQKFPKDSKEKRTRGFFRSHTATGAARRS